MRLSEETEAHLQDRESGDLTAVERRKASTTREDVLGLGDGNKVAKMPQFHALAHYLLVWSGNKHRLSQWRGNRPMLFEKERNL